MPAGGPLKSSPDTGCSYEKYALRMSQVITAVTKVPFRHGPRLAASQKKLLTGEHKDRSLSVFKPSSVSSFCFSAIISQPSAGLYSVRDFKYAMAMLSLKDSTTRSSSAASLTISGVTPIASAISSYSAAISSSAG